MPVVPIRWVLIRDPDARFRPQALLCTDVLQAPAQIVCWFVRRWCVEVTFQETRAHLGVETQRQWSDKAIARTTPCLLALPSRPVLGRHAARHTAPSPPTPLRRSRRVVPQAASDLRRCPRRRALCDLARASFGDITVSTPPNKTPLPPNRALGLCPLPCCMKGQSRA